MIRLPLLFVVVTTLVIATPRVRGGEPKVLENVLMKPTFLLTDFSWSGGSAFLLRVTDRPETLLVTCHHLFGPATGLRKQMTSQEIARDVRGAVGLSMQDRKTIVIAQTYLAVPDARGVDQAGGEKDFAVFVVQLNEKHPALDLAEPSPRVGHTVYLFARLRSEEQPRLHPATVTQVEENWLLYAFDDKDINLSGTSGAPVLDETGKVIGMNVGAGKKNGQVMGMANPAARMRELIKLSHK